MFVAPRDNQNPSPVGATLTHMLSSICRSSGARGFGGRLLQTCRAYGTASILVQFVVRPYWNDRMQPKSFKRQDFRAESCVSTAERPGVIVFKCFSFYENVIS